VPHLRDEQHLQEFDTSSILGGIRRGFSVSSILGAYLASRKLDKIRARSHLRTPEIREYFARSSKAVVRSQAVAELRARFDLSKSVAGLVVSEYLRLTRNGKRTLPQNI
jgi:hypothetical protein